MEDVQENNYINLSRETKDSNFTGAKNFLEIIEKERVNLNFFKGNSGYIFKQKYRIVWRKIENVKNINEINHKAVTYLLKYLNIKEGLEIHYYGDLPARSGMGSSSSFTVGLMQALYKIKNIKLTRAELTKKSINLSR